MRSCNGVSINFKCHFARMLIALAMATYRYSIKLHDNFHKPNESFMAHPLESSSLPALMFGCRCCESEGFRVVFKKSFCAICLFIKLIDSLMRMEFVIQWETFTLNGSEKKM